MILKSASVSRIRGREMICILTGILTALLIALIPQGIFAPGTENTPMNLLFQLAGGFIIAVALVLPGISASQMLYMLGIYESTLKAISSLDIFAASSLSCWWYYGNLSHSPYSGAADQKAQRSHFFNDPGLYAGIAA